MALLLFMFIVSIMLSPGWPELVGCVMGMFMSRFDFLKYCSKSKCNWCDDTNEILLFRNAMKH